MFSRAIVEAFLGVTPLSHSWKLPKQLPSMHRGVPESPFLARGTCVGCFLMGSCGAQVGRHGHGPTWVRQTLLVSTGPSLRLTVWMCVCLFASVCIWVSLSVVWAERSL